MAHDVLLPELGESVTEGTVTRWLKQVGDEVAADEPLLEVSIDKVDTEIPAPAAGTLLEIVVEEDGTVEVGGRLAVIGAAGEVPRPPSSGGEVRTPSAAGKVRTSSRDEATRTPAPGEGVRTPAAAPEQAPTAGTAPAQAPAPPPATDPTPTPATAPDPTPETTPAATVAAPYRPPAAVPARETAPAPADRSAAPSPTAGPASSPRVPGPRAGVPYATPVVRKLAREQGVDLSSVTGTGAGGRIRRADLTAVVPTAARPAQQPAPPPVTEGAAAPQVSLRGRTVPMPPARRTRAAALLRAVREQAQLTTVVEVDLTEVLRLRDCAADVFAAREGMPLTTLPFVVAAAARALKAHPSVHARVDGETGEVTYFGTEHIALPVDTEQGVVAPALRDVGGLGVAGIARGAAGLAADARAGRLGPDAEAGATFTVHDAGERGVLFETAVVPSGRTAALGIGAVAARPVAVRTTSGEDGDEAVAVRRKAHLALSYDHRLVDGADAARYLAAVKHLLEEGAFAAEVGL
ncbi:2-oxo acid dehydrogenase subunit E2 [Streptomyces sp. enrichment culture]|uniref:2-oxo acid dehydrogenase subunit E2 n=1 Tax=Streptomyces sp. enrichment culture TaxID=1795815 RepID=UPI003F551C6C